jgi:hypothetical protein
MRGIFILVFAFVCLASCGQSASTSSARLSAPPKTVAEVWARVPRYTALVENKNKFPRDYDKFGKSEMKRINNLTYWAGVAALNDPLCNVVDSSSFSAQVEAGDLVWFVDCSNGHVSVVQEQDAINAKMKWARASRARATEKST